VSGEVLGRFQREVFMTTKSEKGAAVFSYFEDAEQQISIPTSPVPSAMGEHKEEESFVVEGVSNEMAVRITHRFVHPVKTYSIGALIKHIGGNFGWGLAHKPAGVWTESRREVAHAGAVSL
jgi:hypothetical protein